MASEFDWYQVKFLESTANLKKVVKASIGRTPSSQVARNAGVCIQQGRLFYESAARAPLEIRPLLIFYGMVGFAKALVVARQCKGLATLPARHGLEDTSDQHANLEDLRVNIEGDGTFQRFNDTVADLERINFYSSLVLHSLATPTCKSVQLQQKKFTLKSILERIPGLANLYQKTFNERHKTILCYPTYWADDLSYGELQINTPEMFNDLQTLEIITRIYREIFPFLNNWCFAEGSRDFKGSTLIFSSVDKGGIHEFSEQLFIKPGSGFVRPIRNAPDYRHINVKEIMVPLSGGISNNTPYAIAPFEGLYISELSLYYLGMYLLSSLVRYHPQIWMHSISRLATNELPADDKALALIEQFMDLSLSVFPTLIVNAISLR
jgi:hypothetical protein